MIIVLNFMITFDQYKPANRAELRGVAKWACVLSTEMPWRFSAADDVRRDFARYLRETANWDGRFSIEKHHPAGWSELVGFASFYLRCGSGIRREERVDYAFVRADVVSQELKVITCAIDRKLDSYVASRDLGILLTLGRDGGSY